MTPVGFEPTQLALVELESTPLDHSGKVSCVFGPAQGHLGRMFLFAWLVWDTRGRCYHASEDVTTTADGIRGIDTRARSFTNA
jgi:hypothetical protein